LTFRLWLLSINGKTIASKEYRMQNNIKISFNDLEISSQTVGNPRIHKIFNKVFEKFGINYEKEFFESFCKFKNNKPIIGSESHALDLCGNALKISEPMQHFRKSAALYIPLHLFSHSCALNTF
jgi:hypothetical protein